MNPQSYLLGAMLANLIFVSAAQSGQQQQGTTTLVLSQVPGGEPAVRVVDPNSGAERQQVEQEQDEQLEEQVVSGLLEWLEKKKKKKKEKKEGKKQEAQPTAAPYARPAHGKKEIHIHITINNNHNKKQHDQQHQKHKKHGYEQYHEGHHDQHDKHYSGKHSWPLLGHHHNWDMDFFSANSGDHHADDYGGYESKQVENQTSYNATETNTTTTTTEKPSV